MGALAAILVCLLIILSTLATRAHFRLFDVAC